jgi:hypothetical protein
MKRLLLVTATLIIGLSIFSSAVAAKTKDCREVQYKKKCIATIESTDFGTFTGIFHRRVFKGKTVGKNTFGEIGEIGNYEGGLINENFSGQGTLSMSDNFYYEGDFKEGQLHGTGTMYFAEALGEYSGEWKDSKYEGQGTLTLADGEKYVGEWKDGNENGQGTYTWPSGRKYVGEWKDGKYEGQGTITWPVGNKYVGEWKDGKYEGQGTLTYPNGKKYVGEWKDSTYEGQGTLTWPDGKKYVGEWKDGKYEGQGTYTWPDGKKYVGEWKDGNENGQGTVTYPDGNKYVGEWKDGNENGQFTEINANGDKTKRLYEEGIFKGYVQDEILKVADASQINKMALTLKGISFGMTEQQRINVLLDRGYSCFGGKSLFGAYSLTCEIKAEGQKIEINKTSVVFSCQNFNLCSFSAREAGQKLMEQLDMLSMENKTYSLPGYRFPVKNYCGRGPEGDEICVERLDGFGGVPLTLTLKAGDISRGKVSFD